MKSAVDAMGGDHAPREIVRGAVESARANDLSLILVGQEARIRAELGAVDVSGADIEVLHASEVVEMCDIPAIALRKKRDSSTRERTSSPSLPTFCSSGTWARRTPG